MVKKVNEIEFDSLAKEGKVLVDFSASWCGPCQMLAPIIDELSEELTDVKFLNVDVDNCENIAQTFGISAIPALYLLQDGKVVKSTLGFMPKEQVKKFIEEKYKGAVVPAF